MTHLAKVDKTMSRINGCFLPGVLEHQLHFTSTSGYWEHPSVKDNVPKGHSEPRLLPICEQRRILSRTDGHLRRIKAASHTSHTHQAAIRPSWCPHLSPPRLSPGGKDATRATLTTVLKCPSSPSRGTVPCPLLSCCIAQQLSGTFPCFPTDQTHQRDALRPWQRRKP